MLSKAAMGKERGSPNFSSQSPLPYRCICIHAWDRTARVWSHFSLLYLKVINMNVINIHGINVIFCSLGGILADGLKGKGGGCCAGGRGENGNRGWWWSPKFLTQLQVSAACSDRAVSAASKPKEETKEVINPCGCNTMSLNHGAKQPRGQWEQGSVHPPNGWTLKTIDWLCFLSCWKFLSLFDLCSLYIQNKPICKGFPSNYFSFGGMGMPCPHTRII